jgi:hypothetical protein
MPSTTLLFSPGLIKKTPVQDEERVCLNGEAEKRIIELK